MSVSSFTSSITGPTEVLARAFLRPETPKNSPRRIPIKTGVVRIPLTASPKVCFVAGKHKRKVGVRFAGKPANQLSKKNSSYG